MSRARWTATLLSLLTCVALSSHAGAPPTGDEVLVRDAWARATPPGAAVAAVYLTVVGGAKADTLLAATTDVAAMTQVHAVTESEGLSRMRATDRVAVPARQTIVFAPHGLHLMLMDLARPLVAGDSFEVTLRFAEAGARTARVDVVAADRPAPLAH